MKMIPLSEFQRITQLSDKAIVWLINQQEIEMQVDSKRGLLISPESATTRSLVNAITSSEQSATQAKKALIIEKLASIIDDGLDDIVDAALVRLLSK